MSTDAKHGFSVWVLPPEGGRVRKFSLSVAKLGLLAFVIGTLLGVLIIVAGDYVRMHLRGEVGNSLFQSMQSDHGRLLQENRKLSSSLAKMKNSRGDVVAYENKVRDRLKTLADLFKTTPLATNDLAVNAPQTSKKSASTPLASQKGKAFFSYSDSQSLGKKPAMKRDVVAESGMGGPEFDCSRSRDAQCATISNIAYAQVYDDTKALRDILGGAELGNLGEGDLLLVLDQVISLLRSVPLLSPSGGAHTSGFGFRVSPFHSGVKLHEGLDFAVPRGSPIFATGDGVVEVVDSNDTYGNYVDIRHSERVVTRYAHMARAYVKEGQVLQRGTLVGAVGSTGRSTGPHLHYEVRINGQPKNPEVFLALAQKLSRVL